MVSKHHLLILQTLPLFGSLKMSEHLHFGYQEKKKKIQLLSHVFAYYFLDSL